MDKNPNYERLKNTNIISVHIAIDINKKIGMYGLMVMGDLEIIPNKQKWDTLSKELKVAVTIQKLNDSGEVPYFSNIARHLAKFDDMSKTTVHNALNHLIDLGTINAEWTKVGSAWVRKFFVIGESREFINKLVEELYD